MMDKGMVKDENTCNLLFINTKTTSKKLSKETAYITLKASFTPVCLTTPLYEPTTKKLTNANTKTNGCWYIKSWESKLKEKLKRMK